MLCSSLSAPSVVARVMLCGYQGVAMQFFEMFSRCSECFFYDVAKVLLCDCLDVLGSCQGVYLRIVIL